MSASDGATRGDELISRLSESQLTPVERSAAVSALLHELWGGFPVERLVELIHNPQEDTVDSAAWIVSELGARAAPLVSELRWLLEHRSGYARFFALDAVLNVAGVDDGDIVAIAIFLIDDADWRVQSKAIKFLAYATTEQLNAGALHLGDGSLVDLTRWLTAQTPDDQDQVDIERRLASSDRRTRLFAAAASARVAPTERRPLSKAAGSADALVARFAQFELHMLNIRARRDPRKRRDG